MFFMMPLNVIGELAKIVSISFRLFGNIMGGSIIILVVSHLTYSVVLPPASKRLFRTVCRHDSSVCIYHAHGGLYFGAGKIIMDIETQALVHVAAYAGGGIAMGFGAMGPPSAKAIRRPRPIWLFPKPARFPAICLKICWWVRPWPNRPPFLPWSSPFCCSFWTVPMPVC